MKLLMLSGDRQTPTGARGPFWAMQQEFSRWFERIDVLCPRPVGPVTVREICGTVHFHPAQVGRLGMLRYLRARGAELVREHAPQLIVSHDYGWFYNGLAAAHLARTTGVPYLSEIHHVPGVPVAADRREVFDRAVARRYVRWARSRALAFRVVNAGQMPDLLASWGVPREQIRVLPSLYIDLERFAPPPGPVTPEQDVLFVGRMVNNKGLFPLVDALALRAAAGEPLRATFLGTGPLRESVERRATERGLVDSVRFIDWLDTSDGLADLYRASRVLVCASTCEGGPRVTVEAMACGTPVVSTPVGVMGELLEDGAAGVLCGFDAASIAKALGELLGDEGTRRERGRAARRVAERFEYRTVIEGYARGLHDLVGATARRRPEDAA